MEEDRRFTIAEEDIPQVGDKYRQFGKYLVHVRGLVDDQVVIRWWSKHKQEWRYTCEPLWSFSSRYTFFIKVGGKRKK